MSLYTAFSAAGVQRTNRTGQHVLCRTLQRIREYAQPGDTVYRWGNAGQCTGEWKVSDSGTFQRQTRGR